MNENNFSKVSPEKQSDTSEKVGQDNRHKLVLLSVKLVVVNILISFDREAKRAGSSFDSAALENALGMITGIILLPFIIAGIFQIGIRYRNAHSRAYIFLGSVDPLDNRDQQAY